MPIVGQRTFNFGGGGGGGGVVWRLRRFGLLRQNDCYGTLLSAHIHIAPSEGWPIWLDGGLLSEASLGIRHFGIRHVGIRHFGISDYDETAASPCC